MIYRNTPQLRQWLVDAKYGHLVDKDEFGLDDAAYKKYHAEIAVQHPMLTADQMSDRTALRCLTLTNAAPTQAQFITMGVIHDKLNELISAEADRHAQLVRLIQYGVAALIVLLVIDRKSTRLNSSH